MFWHFSSSIYQLTSETCHYSMQILSIPARLINISLIRHTKNNTNKKKSFLLENPDHGQNHKLKVFSYFHSNFSIYFQLLHNPAGHYLTLPNLTPTYNNPSLVYVQNIRNLLLRILVLPMISEDPFVVQFQCKGYRQYFECELCKIMFIDKFLFFLYNIFVLNIKFLEDQLLFNQDMSVFHSLTHNGAFSFFLSFLRCFYVDYHIFFSCFTFAKAELFVVKLIVISYSTQGFLFSNNRQILCFSVWNSRSLNFIFWRFKISKIPSTQINISQQYYSIVLAFPPPSSIPNKKAACFFYLLPPFLFLLTSSPFLSSQNPPSVHPCSNC